MTVTGYTEEQMKEELTVYLRNSDVLTTTLRGVTTITEEFDGDGNETEFTLTNTNVKNIRSITVGGVAQVWGTDYTVNYETAKVTFTVAPASGTDNVDITYDYGNTDKIHADMPKVELNISSYPRIAITVTSVQSQEGALDGSIIYSNYLISFTALREGNQSVEELCTAVRTAILNNRKNFYTMRYLSPAGKGPTLPEPQRGDKIFSKVCDFTAPWNSEVLS